MVAMSVLVEALNRSALLKNGQSSQPQARPMPRVIPVLGTAAGACIGFGMVMAVGSTLLSSVLPVPPQAAPLGSVAAQPSVEAAAKPKPSVAEQVRLLPIVEPLAADLDYYRSTKPIGRADGAAPAQPSAPVAPEPAKLTAGDAPPRDPTTAATIKSLEAQLERQPENLEFMSQLLGIISAQPPQAALSDLLRLYQAYPRQHVLAAQLGYTYARLNDQESALRYQQWAVTLAPNNPVFLFNVAVLQDRLGKREEATRSYQQVLLRSNAGGPPVPMAAVRERLDYLARN